MKKGLKISKAVLLIICISCLIIISRLTTLYGDDFTYGTYYMDGFGEFLRLNVRHYQLVNGRAFVHLVLESVLAFRDRLFFIVLPLLVCGAFTAFYKSFVCNKERTKLITFLTLSISGVMCLSVIVLREGLLWMSGAMNYIFPLIFTYSTFYIAEKADEGKCRWYYLFIAFFAGATTEQGGAMSLAVAIMYIFYYRIITGKKPEKKVYIIAFIVFLGYLSIFLSPATFGRLFAETAKQSEGLNNRFKHLFLLCFGEGGALWLFVLAELSLLTELARKNKYLLFGGLILLAASTVIIIFISQSAGGFFMIGLIALTAIAMLVTKTSPKLATAMIAAGAGIVMLVCSTSFGYRNLIPAYFTMIAVIAAVPLKFLSKRVSVLEVLASGAVVATALIIFTPVLSGYAENRKVLNQNLAAYENEAVIDYNLGVKYPYNYVQFFEVNGVYRREFKKLYHIPEDTKIRFCGEKFEDFSCNGIECKPVYINNGIRYYPLRDVLEKNGWEVSYDNNNETLIKQGDKEITYQNMLALFQNGDTQLDAYQYLCKDRDYRGYFATYTYFSAEVFDLVFGIKVQ